MTVGLLALTVAHARVKRGDTMAAIYVKAPKGCRFKVGGKYVTDTKAIKVDSIEHRIRKALMEGSLIQVEEKEETKKRGRPAKSNPTFTLEDENVNDK